MLPRATCLVAKTDLVKYMLSWPILKGRIGKFLLALSEFDLVYVPQRAVKGQSLADHPDTMSEQIKEEDWERFYYSIEPWKLTFDGSKKNDGAGAGITLQSPTGSIMEHSFFSHAPTIRPSMRP